MAFLQQLMHGAGWQVRDAGGTHRRLYDYFQFGGDVPVPRSTFALVRCECNEYEQPGGRRIFTTLVAVFALVTVVSVARTVLIAKSVWQVLFSVLWAAFVVVAAWAYSRCIRSGPLAYASELLAHGHCASCGYPLTKTAGELTTCSECGAVWKSAVVGASVAAGTDVAAVQAERV
ncbi:MAG: hypothetical protein QM783_11540 [Phycisphaerales bacterium]